LIFVGGLVTSRTSWAQSDRSPDFGAGDQPADENQKYGAACCEEGETMDPTFSPSS